MRILSSLLVILCASVIAQPAVAQSAADYPNKPVTLVVPYPPGGPTDVIARLVAIKLSDRLGKPIVILNKAGAAGITGCDFVAKAAPDGYTLLLGSVSTNGISPSLYKNLPYDTNKDFIAISQLSIVPNMLVVNVNLPVRTVPELIAYLKQNPGKVFYGTPGSGSSIHLAAELFKMMTGTEMTHVPYKGAAPAMMDVVAGQIQLMFDNTVTAWPQVRAGKVRALAVSTPTRLKTAPDLPALTEFLPGFAASAWHGVFAPAGTPQVIIDRLADAIQSTMKDPAIVEQFAKGDIIPVVNTPAEFNRFLAEDTARWASVIKKLNLKVDY